MRATVEESRANLGRLRQVAELSGGKVPSKAELETAQATLQRAVANEAGARAAVLQARATLKSDQTILKVANDDLSLRPGMTVTAEITTSHRENVLLVPNAALRFIPQLKSAANNKKNDSFVSSLLPKPPSSTSSKPASWGAHQVWVLRDSQPVAVPVSVGATDGHQTEVSGGDLKPGMQVITESVVAQK